MIKNREGEKVSAVIKAKIELAEYLKKFDLENECVDYSDLKRTEPDKINEQIRKFTERMNKSLIVK